MRGYPSGVQDHCPAAGEECLQLSLDIERVLGIAVRQPVRAVFRFSPRSPLVVCADLRVVDGPRALWHIGRDLLRDGLRRRSGTGDVQAWPSPPLPGRGQRTVRLQLASRDMAALFELPAQPLAGWLRHTYEQVPAGRELSGVDWAATAAGLLGAPGHTPV
ncbi:SsgA family sporulation/cell division regulator [Streptomyces sp. NPDC048111]|uniref:SsgA family sporulation/cell division regulator n=1 Tax=Streptomyces sp. NPDC048111 TaxID=3365500 RepID=UPI0037179B3B